MFFMPLSEAANVIIFHKLKGSISAINIWFFFQTAENFNKRKTTKLYLTCA